MDHQAEEKYGLLADGEAEAQSSYTPNSQGRPTSRPRYRRSITKRRFFYSAICTFALLGLFRAFYFNFLCPSHKHTAATHKSTSISPLAANATYKVPLEAHIMSKCPDTKDCLRDLVIPAMEKIYDKVDFKLSYLGTIEKDNGITCKHGPTECLGNILELCAVDIYPDPKIYLGFTICMTDKYTDIPSRELVHDCALEHGVDFDKLNDCVSEQGKGMDLLEASVRRTIDKGVKYSCTVRLNDTVRCIRDGGEWRDCEGGSDVKDLVKDVEDIYKANS